MSRKTLRQLVEDLAEQDLPPASRVLEALYDSRRGSGPLHALDTAPEDDEPWTPEGRASVEEALRGIEEGKPGLTPEELERARLG